MSTKIAQCGQGILTNWGVLNCTHANLNWLGEHLTPVVEFFTTKSLVGETCPVDSNFSKLCLRELQREEPGGSLACAVQDENKLPLLIISTSLRELSPNSSTGTGPSITFVLELVQIDPRKPQSEMTGCCTACAAKTAGSSPPGASGISGRSTSIWGLPAAQLIGGCWVEISTLVVLPRNPYWLAKGRQPVWNGPVSTNIADCITGGMSSSLLNLGIFFIVLVAEFVSVVKLTRGSRRTVLCLLWPTLGGRCMLGVSSTMLAKPILWSWRETSLRPPTGSW